MSMETWVKPNGIEIQINTQNCDAARQLGWMPKGLTLAPEAPALDEISDLPKRRGRPPKISES